MGRHRPRGLLPGQATKKDLRAEASTALASALQDDTVTNALRVVLRRVALPTAALLLDAVLRPPPENEPEKKLPASEDPLAWLGAPASAGIAQDEPFAIGDELRGEDWPDWGVVRAIVDDTLIVAQPREDGPARIVGAPPREVRGVRGSRGSAAQADEEAGPGEGRQGEMGPRVAPAGAPEEEAATTGDHDGRKALR